jgi:hypothetical protein
MDPHGDEPAPASGTDLLEALAAFLDERLPAISLTDPAREHLVRFRATLTPMHLALLALQPEVRR